MITTMHKTLTVQRRVLRVGGWGAQTFSLHVVSEMGGLFTTSAVTPREVKRVAMMEKLTGVKIRQKAILKYISKNRLVFAYSTGTT